MTETALQRDYTAEEAHMRNEFLDLLQLEGDELDRAADDLIEQRTAELVGQSVPTLLSAVTEPYEGFIHPETEIAPRLLGVGFKLDDPAIYKEVFPVIKAFAAKEPYNAEKPERWFRTLAMLGVQYAINNYFGSSGDRAGNLVERERLLSRGTTLDEEDDDSGVASIREFKGMAFCAEKAAVAQNLLQFLGIESTYVTNGRLQVGERAKELHAFNLLMNLSGEEVLYDSSNPMVIFNTEGKAISHYPAAYKGVEELLETGELSVTHRDFVRREDRTKTPVETPYVFGIPKLEIHRAT